jgi:integrase
MAYTRKLASGRFQGIAKSGRVIIGTRTFTRMADAQAWAERTENAAAGGVDVRAGKIPMRDLLAEWVGYRWRTVAPKTARTDAELLRLVSPALGARSAGTVMPNEVERWFVYLRHQRGQSDGSIRRYRASISSFFAWCVAEHRRVDNPVTAARLPTRLELPAEMRPFNEDELIEVVDRVRLRSPMLADITLIAGWTGLRWGELRALRVGDVQELPSPAFWVSRSQTEGGKVKVTKGRLARRVPLADVVIETVRRAASSKSPDDYLATGVNGGQLWRSAFQRASSWETVAMGRRFHDLRHTAACLWLTRGVDLSTVSAWLGHASVTTTNRYLHYLGTAADSAGLERLNRARGAHGVHAPTTSNEISLWS